MRNYVNLDLPSRRMHCRATGVWDENLAIAFRARMIEVADAMCLDGGEFTALTDLTGLSPHSQAIARIVGEGASQLLQVRLDRYAMIVPTALMRFQVRRIHPEVAVQFFDTCTEATIWLGWTEPSVLVLRAPSSGFW